MTGTTVLCLRLSKICTIDVLAVTGYKSWRHPESGSWFIRELVKTFANFAYKEHFLDLLVKVCLSRCLLSFDAVLYHSLNPSYSFEQAT